MERILDVYDDHGKSLIGSELVKLGHVRSAEFTPRAELSKYPDDLFALVLTTPRGGRLRKYACDNAGSTEVSTAYLCTYYPNLPPEAVKVAASNLSRAREVYGLGPSQVLQWLADGGAEKLAKGDEIQDPKVGPPASSDGSAVAKTTSPSQKLEVGGPKGDKVLHPGKPPTLEGVPRGFRVETGLRDRFPTTYPKAGDTVRQVNDLEDELLRHLRQQKEAAKKKKADTTGTELMPVTPPKGSPPVIKKLSCLNTAPDGETLAQKYPEAFGLVKRACREVMGHPVNSITELGAACRHIEKIAHPREKFAYARGLAERYSEIGLPIPQQVLQYSGCSYRDAEDLAAAVHSRNAMARDFCKTADYTPLFKARATKSPLEFADAMADLDRKYGLEPYWGTRIQDPWSASLAQEKTATVIYAQGDVFVNDYQLKHLARAEKEALAKILDEDLVEEFCRNPVQVFKSMPDPVKKTIGRLAMDQQVRGEVR